MSNIVPFFVPSTLAELVDEELLNYEALLVDTLKDRHPNKARVDHLNKVRMALNAISTKCSKLADRTLDRTDVSSEIFELVRSCRGALVHNHALINQFDGFLVAFNKGHFAKTPVPSRIAS